MSKPTDRPTREDFIEIDQKMATLNTLTECFITQLRNQILQLTDEELIRMTGGTPRSWWAIPYEALEPDDKTYIPESDLLEIDYTKTYCGEPTDEYLLIPFKAVEAKDIDEAMKIYFDYCKKRYTTFLDNQIAFDEKMKKAQEQKDFETYQKLKARFEPQQETDHGQGN